MFLRLFDWSYSAYCTKTNLENMPKKEDLFRYIIIGDTEVGKSSILLQFTEQQFQTEHDMTIGVEMGSRVVDVGPKKVKLEIWDTAGQESYLSVTRSYYRGADGCLLVYDIANRNSFDSLSMWLSEARQNSNNPNLVILMIGNKADLEEKREVSFDEANGFAQSNGLTFLELSAKSYPQVENAFLQTARDIMNKISEHGQAQQSGIKLASAKKPAKGTAKGQSGKPINKASDLKSDCC